MSLLTGLNKLSFSIRLNCLKSILLALVVRSDLASILAMLITDLNVIFVYFLTKPNLSNQTSESLCLVW